MYTPVTDFAIGTDAMRVRITRKLAEWVDGVDLSRCREGDVIDLTERQAQLIVAERWAVPARRAADCTPFAADHRPSERLRDKRDQIQQERRRGQRRAMDQSQAA
jgi:hypothetical protein